MYLIILAAGLGLAYITGKAFVKWIENLESLGETDDSLLGDSIEDNWFNEQKF